MRKYCRLLMSSEELRLFDKIRVFLDEDYSSAEHFTVSCEIFARIFNPLNKVVLIKTLFTGFRKFLLCARVLERCFIMGL